MKIRHFIIATGLMLAAGTAFGQSSRFNVGQWVEIQNAILRELHRSYVDTLPLSRMERAGIDAMLEELDPYTVYMPEEENENLQMLMNKTYGGIGAVIYKPERDGNVIINEPYADSPAARAGIVCGDEIMEIDGKSVKGLATDECSSRMKGKPGTVVTFKMKRVRTGKIETVKVRRERIHLPDVEYAGMLDDTTGYILQTGFTENVSGAVRSAFLKLKDQGMKRLVLDLRGNGGGLMHEAVNIVSLFVPQGSLVVTQKGRGEEDCQEYRTTMAPLDTLMPIIVMVDSGSASSSEIVTGALQDRDRAVVMGKRTYGKGLVQGIRPLPYNGTMKVTTSRYYTPSGRCVQALDYSHRNADGSAGHIPDSLTREFKTLHGRTVRDGGGIMPDIEIASPQYSRLVYSLVMNGIINEYAIEYVRLHESIAPVDEFHFSDEDYEHFIGYAKGRKFDSRSAAKAMFDQMKAELEKDGLAEGVSAQLEALGKAVDMEKEEFLRLKKEEIIPFIEEEVVTRYYFQEAGVKLRLRYDTQLKEALRAELPK